MNKIHHNTYVICKELCKDISESILWVFYAFETKFQLLLTKKIDLQNHIGSQEQATSALDGCVVAPEAKWSELT